MKLLVLLPLTLPGISGLLIGFGHNLLEYLSPSVQVVFVMALFPLVMNIIQFCLVDQVIKGGKEEEYGKGEDEEDMLDDYERLPGAEHDTDEAMERNTGVARPTAGLKARFSLSDQSHLDHENSSSGPLGEIHDSEPLFDVGEDPATDDEESYKPAQSKVSDSWPSNRTSRADEAAHGEARRSLSPTIRNASHTRSELVGLTDLQTQRS